MNFAFEIPTKCVDIPTKNNIIQDSTPTMCNHELCHLCYFFTCGLIRRVLRIFTYRVECVFHRSPAPKEWGIARVVSTAHATSFLYHLAIAIVTNSYHVRKNQATPKCCTRIHCICKIHKVLIVCYCL